MARLFSLSRWVNGPASKSMTLIMCLLLGNVTLAGCEQAKPKASALKPGAPDPVLSKSLDAQGLRAKKSEDAVKLFRQAIQADPYNGNAHNNLGVALMRQGDYFHAAQEFDQATHLMPSNPQPRVNLGLLYEEIGQLKNAEDTYDQALVVSPDYVGALQDLARVRIKREEYDEKTLGLLQKIELEGTSDSWRNWARKERIRIQATGNG